MMKLMIVLFSFYLCSLPIMADAQQRAGNSRGHEVDILRDTFAFSAKDIDVDIKSVYQGCQKRDCIPSIDRPSF
jgi:hypothetical protein